jgi:hypothetical protein
MALHFGHQTGIASSLLSPVHSLQDNHYATSELLLPGDQVDTPDFLPMPVSELA